MKVDVAHLRAFASAIDDVGVATATLNAIGPGSQPPGSAVALECDQATEFVEGAYLRVADRVRQMAAIARGNADDYDVTEADFTGQLAAMGEHA
jgi:hypothetical protein